MIIIKCLTILLFNIQSYILPNIYNTINRINNFENPILLLSLQKDINETYNSSFDNVKSIEYDEEQDLWILDLELPNSELSDIEQHDDFPSFNEFLKNRKKNEQALVRQYFEKSHIREINDMESKHLTILTHSETIEWSKIWVYDMINSGSSDNYPKFIYDNIYDMRELCKSNTDKMFFCIGYIPNSSIYGPYYIGLFELNTINRELHTHMIVQNPNYLVVDNDKDIFNNYKKELIYITSKADISFKYDMLKNIPQCERYYLSWLYNDM